VASELGLSAQIRLRRVAAGANFVLDVKLECGVGLNVLFGPSGSGKSTILQAIAGLLRPDAGRITLAERTLFDANTELDLPPDARRVALVFQSLALFPHLDALGNVAYGLPRGVPKQERLERAESWLTRMRVGHLTKRYPSSFSGGEAQRVALARALASEPSALLLDEPFSALDQSLASELSVELAAYVASRPMPIVLVTHDRNLARKLGKNVILLRGGSIEQVGLARELLADRD
jgi:molybdate transport system ATP-binding protein